MDEQNETTQVIETPETAEVERPTGGRHPVNIGHLVMGLAFAGLLGIWALVVADAVPGDDLSWLLPVPWILGGGIGLIAVVLSGRRRNRWS